MPLEPVLTNSYKGLEVKEIYQNYLNKSHYLDTWDKGTPENPVRVDTENYVEWAIEFTSGDVLTVDSCGCCGGCEIR